MVNYERIMDLLSRSNTFLIATVDTRNFPSVIVVSKPINQEGLQRLQFYVSRDSDSVRNILENTNGAVCCYQELEHESLLLKGKFSVQSVSDPQLLEKRLTLYQKELDYQDPVILTFETLTARIHMDKETMNLII